MIELTVKTLDSQNHSFTVEDDITVADFKQKIAEAINIPADTQRIIYCGRVLKDDVKLSEYDVNGKVVHLVQRAPPSSTQTPNRPSSPQAQRRNAREFEHGMYLGSMAFPSNLMDAQGIVPPPPTHSLAASRLNVAKRMLRKAEAALTTLENPGVRPSERTPPDEPQEEVTPVFEARVIVPNNSLNEPIDEVLTAVQNSLFNATAVVNGGPSVVLSDNGGAAEIGAMAANNLATSEMELPAVHSVSSTPEGASPVSVSTENLAAETQRSGANTTEGGTSANTLAENASRTSEMADLLDTLGRLQVRFAPFLEQYHNFMRQDPTIPAADARKTQAMINCVSEILHFLGHAYHSLSDIIVRVRTPAPRPLLCRPILIQHSAVVQTGFPIQVEAQINFSPDGNAMSGPQQPATSSTGTSTQQQGATPTSSASTAANVLPQMGPTITTHMQPHMLGLPLLPGAVHVQSFPIEIRGIQRPTGNQQTGRPGSSGETPAGDVPPTTTSNGTTAAPPPPPTTTTTTTTGAANGSPFNNPNMEFFMEVTPESITIDSLETASNDAVILRGALNGPPSDFLQSIMQMAEQIISRSGGGAASATTTAAPSQSSEPSTTQQATQNTTQPQNSQARGNTQTNPTTSTHTRSTPRPHVHLAQHTMQGFDPFLPCNSHHVTPRRRIQARTLVQQQQQGSQQNSNGRQEAPQQNNAAANPIYNIVQGIVNSFRNVYRQRNPGGQQQGSSSAAQPAENTTPEVNTMTNGQATPPAPPPPPSGDPVLPPQHPLSSLNMNLSISQTLQRFSDINYTEESYTEGESVFTDLVMLLLRNLTIRDLMLLNNSRLDPLLRIRSEIRNFFLYQVLDGTNTVASIDRGVSRLISEMQPFWNNFQHLEVRDDIDIVRSIEMLFKTRLPNIISLATSHNPNSLRMLVEQCRITLRQLCALIVHASAEGLRRIDEVIDLHLVRRYLGTPRDIDMLRTYLVSRAYLRRFLSGLSVPESILQPYIVRRVDSAIILPPAAAEAVQIRDDEPIGEPMELDEQEASGSSNELGGPLINLQEDLEPLPAVDIGSDSWHSQVPADWVPIIVRDTQRQRRQNPQPAFSDAYLSGMPSKRRKIVTSSKPQGTLPQVIQESVRHAVTASGLTTVAPLDTVSEAAAADINIQAAYRELLRSSVQSNLQNNEDFTPERFPNATNYFSKQPQ